MAKLYFHSLGNWADHSDLKPLVKKAETTGRKLGVGVYSIVEQVKIEGAMYAAKRYKVGSSMNTDTISKKFSFVLKNLRSLRHPNIVRYEGVCDLPDSRLPALVMEQLATNLHDFLDCSHKTLPLKTKFSILHDVASGLAYLHNHKPVVIHCDLTATNILLSGHIVAKISDFDNSRFVDSDPAEFQITPRVPFHIFFMPPENTIHFSDTIFYMPPEASSNPARFTCKFDVFSFGHLALFTVTQVFPCDLLLANFCGNDEAIHTRTEVERRQKYIDLLEQQLQKNHKLVTLIGQCLDNRPRRRPTAADIETKMQVASNSSSCCDL